jgi:hypothetical protein
MSNRTDLMTKINVVNAFQMAKSKGQRAKFKCSVRAAEPACPSRFTLQFEICLLPFEIALLFTAVDLDDDLGRSVQKARS